MNRWWEWDIPNTGDYENTIGRVGKEGRDRKCRPQARLHTESAYRSERRRGYASYVIEKECFTSIAAASVPGTNRYDVPKRGAGTSLANP